MSIKEDRHQLFSDWATSIKNKDWDNADINAELLLHTLPRGSEQRNQLEQGIEQIQLVYKEEDRLLQNLISSQNNPFQKEQLKNKKIELDEWRANQIHHLFMQRFLKDSLITSGD